MIAMRPSASIGIAIGLVASASIGALAVACGTSAEDTCENLQLVACQKAFECEPDSAYTQLVQTESNCTTVAQQACTSSQLCSNPPCCGIFVDGGLVRMGTFNANYASMCANEISAGSCDLFDGDMTPQTPACLQSCQ